jgi:hypothetical protein
LDPDGAHGDDHGIDAAAAAVRPAAFVRHGRRCYTPRVATPRSKAYPIDLEIGRLRVMHAFLAPTCLIPSAMYFVDDRVARTELSRSALAFGIGAALVGAVLIAFATQQLNALAQSNGGRAPIDVARSKLFTRIIAAQLIAIGGFAASVGSGSAACTVCGSIVGLTLIFMFTPRPGAFVAPGSAPRR